MVVALDREGQPFADLPHRRGEVGDRCQDVIALQVAEHLVAIGDQVDVGEREAVVALQPILTATGHQRGNDLVEVEVAEAGRL